MKNRETIGIILLNLGGPDSIQAVRPFLYNLFSDRKIIQLGPPFLQKPIAWLIAMPRSKKTESYYRLIGGRSPILDITNAQAKALEETLNGSRFTVHGSLPFKVYVGMRYWHPLIEDVIPQIYNDGIRKLIGLSLYPQYSLATSGSSFSKLKETVHSSQFTVHSSQFTVHGSQFTPFRDESLTGFTVHCITSWYAHPLYIEALVDVIRKGIESFTPSLTLPPRGGGKGGGDIHVLFSAHSLPEKFIDEGDPYVRHIEGTIEEIIKRMPINPVRNSSGALNPAAEQRGIISNGVKWHLSYQSKSGPVKWLGPSTDEKLKELAGRNIKNILIVPISFVSDHIETLYEIDILYMQMAKDLGINLIRTDSLNTHPLFIEALKDIVIKNIKELGWTE